MGDRQQPSLLQGVHEACDYQIKVFVGAAQLFDLVDGVKHGGVVLAPELPADLRKRGGSELVDDVQVPLARESDGPGVAAHLQILLAEIEMFADALLNEVDRDTLFLRSDDVGQHLLRGGQRNRHAGQRSVGHQAGQRAFELPHVGLDGAGDVFSDVIGQREAVVFRLFLQDGNFGFQIGRLNVRDKSPLESRPQSFLDGVDVLGQAVRGNHDLLLQLVKRVEGVKELLLRAFFSGDELDVVDQQDVHSVETVAERDHAVEAQRIDHFDGEFLGADVAQAHGGIALLDGVPDGVHQVRLAHAHAAIKKERVVRFGGLLGHRARCGVRKFIGLADHEGVEGVAQVELVVVVVEIELGLLRGRHGGGPRCLFFGADILHLDVRRAKLVKHGLNDFTVGARQNLAEYRAGDLNV